MTYHPRKYWDARATRQGPAYVGPGGDPERADRERLEFEAVLSHLLPDVDTLLDFGCGSGRLTPWLMGRCDRYIGVDISRVGLDLARDRVPWRENTLWVHVGSGQELPLEDGSVGAVVAAVVLQHITDPGVFWTTCRELSRVVRPGGRVVVVDMLPVPEPYEHNRGRSPLTVQWALGLPATPYRHVLDNHWAASYTRPEDS